MTLMWILRDSLHHGTQDLFRLIDDDKWLKLEWDNGKLSCKYCAKNIAMFDYSGYWLEVWGKKGCNLANCLGCNLDIFASRLDSFDNVCLRQEQTTSILRQRVNDHALINCVTKTTFIIKYLEDKIPAPMYYHPSWVLSTVIYSHLEWLLQQCNIRGKIFWTCELLHKHPLITPHFSVHPVCQCVSAHQIFYLWWGAIMKGPVFMDSKQFKIYNYVWSQSADPTSNGSILVSSSRFTNCLAQPSIILIV